ncbi:hypothetical protein [Chitinophaga sp.]|uniref:hypothetical protein n=1 Tax=Chitinophaga sp. TaxID=1869181 RepID=UPI0031E19482
MDSKQIITDEKIKSFKRLFTSCNSLIVTFEEEAKKTGKILEENVDRAIANIDEMISMLPIQFPPILEYESTQRMLLINLNDPEDEPKQIAKKNKSGFVSYSVPENVQILLEHSVHMALEKWKFKLLSQAVFLSKDPVIVAKYKPLRLEQAKNCMDKFHFEPTMVAWERDFYLESANVIGWTAFLEEQDPGKLEEALATLEKGFIRSNWYQYSYLKDTKARLLIKMGREAEGYEIIKEGLIHNPDHADFTDFKTDKKFLQWWEEEKEREAAAKIKEEANYQTFLLFMEKEQEKLVNQFVNPDHPLIKEHATSLNLIKQLMLEIELRRQYKKSEWQAPGTKFDKWLAELKKWSVEDIAAYEKTHAIRLPDQLKVYLMEIGEGGRQYFCYNGITMLTDEELADIRKPFPITADKMHPIDDNWGRDVWADPDDKDWKKLKIFPKSANMETLFGLPDGATIQDGCWCFGDSYGQDPLFLIMNGEFEGEVWVDTLQYGAEARGCFAAATPQKLCFLSFLAESIRRKIEGYSGNGYTGSWM